MLQVNQISKSFHKNEVVCDVSFSVKKGEAFGLLGPNGAGKSTTISLICGLFPYDTGEILVGGRSVKQDPMAVKKKIGIVPQEIALYPTMSAFSNLVFWGRMYGLNRSAARKKAAEVLETVGLEEKAKQKIETFSGGMKRRINIGAALMNAPELLIMDEPTVGIDPQSRNHILETVQQLNQNGMTVIYTSHYMEEVDFLCNRIGIIDHGRMIAVGSKTELINRLSSGTLLDLHVSSITEAVVTELKNISKVESVQVDHENHTLQLLVAPGMNTTSDVIAKLVQANIQILSFNRKEPNLESLFLQLTGRSLRD